MHSIVIGSDSPLVTCLGGSLLAASGPVLLVAAVVGISARLRQAIGLLLIGVPHLLLLLICWPIIDRAMYEANCRDE